MPVSKWYLHQAAYAAGGTMPAATTLMSASVQAGTGYFNASAAANRIDTNMTMNGTKGSSPQTPNGTTAASTSPQYFPVRRFVSPALAAQTIPATAASLMLQAGLQVSDSVRSPIFYRFGCLAVWRPSTGALVGRIKDSVTAAGGSSATSSVTWRQSSTSGDTPAAPLAILDNDVLVYEMWVAVTQTMATSYTVWAQYDGVNDFTSDGAAESSAAAVLLTPTIYLLGESPPVAKSDSETDSNMATESTSIVTKLTLSDADTTGFTEVETATARAFVTGTDLTGAEIENAAAVVPVSDADATGVNEVESASYQITAQSLITYDPAPIQTLGDIPAYFNPYTVLPQNYATYADLAVGLPPMPALTEIATITQAFSSTDANGSTTESASILVSVSDVDPTGPETEVVSLVAKITTTDTGTITETFTELHPATDTNGATTEATALAAGQSSADASNPATDSASVVAKISDLDSGVSTEVGNAVAQITPISATDTTGINEVESATANAQIPSSDSGTTSESAGLSVQNFVNSSDTNGATTESGSATKALVSATDSGTIIEVQSMVGGQTTSDVNAGIVESAALVASGLITSDSGTISEAASTRFIVASADVGGASEAAAPTVQISSADGGTASEAATVGAAQLSTSDSAVGIDNGTTGAPLLTGDSGSSSEIATAGAQVSSADLATASEAATSLVTAATTDSGGITAETFRIGLSTSEGGGIPFSPPTLPGLGIWLDASQLALPLESDVATWPNLAAGGAQGSMIGGALNPVLRANGPVGGKCVRFFVNNNRFRMNGNGIGTDWTLAYVGRLVNGGTAGRVVSGIYSPNNILVGYWNGYQDVAYDNGFTSPDVRAAVVWDQWNLYSGDGIIGATRMRFYKDGVLQGTDLTAQGWGGTFALSGYDPTSNAETCDCEVAEVVMYNSQLSAANRQAVEGYLRNKWILGVSGVQPFPGLTEGFLIAFSTSDVATVAEAVLLVESTTVVDLNSATSETASAKAVTVSADSGGSSETASAANKGGDSDAGGISDVATVTRALVASVDTNGIVGETGIASTQNQKADIDFGIVAESATVNAPVSSADSGTISESVSGIKLTVPTADLATINETALLTVKMTTADSGGDSEIAVASAVVVSSDVGGLVETTTVTKNVSDFATGTDTGFVHAYIQDGDTGTGQEGQSRWPPALTFTDIPAGVILEMAMGTFGAPAVGVAREPAKPRGTYVTSGRGRIL